MNMRLRGRSYWEARADKLTVDGWFVGRRDIRSYLMDGGYVHYAYPPGNGERKMFRGSPYRALRAAVLYAEKMNRKDAKP